MKESTMKEYNCLIHWADGSKPSKAKLQQCHIDNLNDLPMVDKVQRGKKV